MESTLKNIILLVSFLSQVYCISQIEYDFTTEALGDKNIYNHSIRFFLKKLENNLLEEKNKDSILFIEANKYFDDFYIIKSDFTSKSLSNIKNQRLIFVDSNKDLKEIIVEKGNKKVLKIIPIRKNKDYFFINIGIYNCSLADDDLEFAIITSLKVKYVFKPSTNEFIPVD